MDDDRDHTLNHGGVITPRIMMTTNLKNIKHGENPLNLIDM